MDPVNYYLTTFIQAFKKLLPLGMFLIGGYFIFFKLPFFFLRKNLQKEKSKLIEKNDEPPKKIDSKEKSKFTEREQHIKDKKKKQNSESTFRKENIKKETRHKKTLTPEEIFNIKENQTISESELKKRYFALLKQNHPDRVASMGEDFKKLAEKNTKDINDAYEKLKKKDS
jgi:DnaJ-domain-containing protein 1